MEIILLGILANILRTYAIYRFMRLLYFSYNTRNFYQNWTYIFFVILTSGGYYLFHNLYINIFTNILGLIFIVLTYEGKFLKNALVILSVYSVNVVIESLVFFMVGLNQSMDVIVESVNECITSIGILLFAVLLEKTKAIRNEESPINVSVWISLISVPIISIIIILVLLHQHESKGTAIEIEIIGILIINLVVFYLYGAIQDYYNEKSKKEEFLKKTEIYANQIKIMSDSYQKTRELRHDMKHHLVELQYLAYQRETEQLVNYIEEMWKHMSNENEYVSSGNEEIDGTLNYLLQRAYKKLNEIEVAITIPDRLEIHNYLFNVILGNLLENAIEAAADTERKYLKIVIKLRKNVLYIIVENTFKNDVKIKDSKILTTKRNVKNHGIGLESVKGVVEEMNGMLDIRWGDEMFCVNVMLYLNSIGTDQ